MAGKRTGLRQAQPERTNRNTQKGVDNMRFASALLASAALLAAAPVHAKPADPEAAKKILKDSVAIPTVEGRGKVPELAAYRSAESRVGKECCSQCRIRWAPYS